MLGLQVAKPVLVAHGDRPGVGQRVRDDLARRRSPLLEVLPERVILLIQAHYLAMPTATHPAQVDAAVHCDEVALEDVRLVVDRAVRILGEAGAADREHHSKRGIGT